MNTNGFRLPPQVKNSRREWHRRAEEATKISHEIATKYTEALQDILAVLQERDRKILGAFPTIAVSSSKIEKVLGKYRAYK